MLRWDMRDSDSDGVVTAAPAVVEDADGELMRAPRLRVVKPAPPEEPRDWRVVTRYPGVSCVPMTLREALLCAKRFRGDVVPWEYQPGEAYPHPGERPSGKPAKYGAALQSGKEEA